MTAQIAGLPFWELVFDAEGDTDAAVRAQVTDEVAGAGVTDLVLFCHGWNSDRPRALVLYERFFGLLADQLRHIPADRAAVVGLGGVVWPSQMWADEPVPDFAPQRAPGTGGGASLTERAKTPDAVADPTVDPVTLEHLRALFPAAREPLDEMAEILAAPPTEAAEQRFHQLLREFCEQAGAAGDDGEDDLDRPAPTPAQPRMLLDDPVELFSRYRDALRAAGVPLDADRGGEAGLGDRLRGLLNGAKEALRQATYWQMKNRAGTVGRAGLGPMLGDLQARSPRLRVHLVGHSFGGRLVSYALAGLPAGADSPVRSVTLLQAAFSHFAFAAPLPFAAGRSGALAGMLSRINGPLVVCFSEHDTAVGKFYPLASLASGDDASGLDDPLFRWGAMGAHGAQGVHADMDSVRDVRPTGSGYRFTSGSALNIDAGTVVRIGDPPSGAHSDILHPELTWVVLAAAGLVP